MRSNDAPETFWRGCRRAVFLKVMQSQFQYRFL
ncbi:hypothetical protein PS659_04006 [Pseudomonas fluorescens]|uniref:Uncharacterized protein n=1 Tax=Pseudomonas fluorescens TaxID=294 RepID=A0A5E6V7L1_PSEFL|nr:hypothetical protein PS659_04006 [Pseudomonas fluorescens]